MLDFPSRFLDTRLVELPALSRALAEHFGRDSDVESPEDESEAWQSIVREFRRGGYSHLLRELDALLAGSDAGLQQFLAAHAPAWTFEGADDARRGIEVFRSYVEAYGDAQT